MEETDAISYDQATNFVSDILENEYPNTVKTSSNAQALASDHCYGLPYQDHSYGGARLSGKSVSSLSISRPHLHASGFSSQNASPPSITNINIPQPPPVAAFAAAHRVNNHKLSTGYQVPPTSTVTGPPTLERNSCSEEETTTMVEIFSPTVSNTGGDRSPDFSHHLPMGGCRSLTHRPATPQQHTPYKQPNDIEVTSTPVGLDGHQGLPNDDRAHPRLVLPSSLFRYRTHIPYDEDSSHSYAARTLTRSSRPPAQHSFLATQTNSSGSGLYYNHVTNLSSESLTASDLMLIGSPPLVQQPPPANPSSMGIFESLVTPPSAMPFPNNLESAPFTPILLPIASSSSAAPCQQLEHVVDSVLLHRRTKERRSRSTKKSKAGTIEARNDSDRVFVLPSCMSVVPVDLTQDSPASPGPVIASPEVSSTGTRKRRASLEFNRKTRVNKRRRSVQEQDDDVYEEVESRDAFSESYNVLMDRLIKQLGGNTSKSTQKKLKKFQEAAAALNKQAADVKAAMLSEHRQKDDFSLEEASGHVASKKSTASAIVAGSDSNTDTDDEDEVVAVCENASVSAVTNVQPPSDGICNEENPSVQTEEKPQGRRVDRASSSSGSDEEGQQTGASEDEWAGQEYTTSCVCQMTHNDELMIQCDRCDVWQHCTCLGLKKKEIPDNFLCHRCQPRPLVFSREKARAIQFKKLKRRAELKRQRKDRKAAVTVARLHQAARRSSAMVAVASERASGTRPPLNAKRRHTGGVLKTAEVVEEFYANFTKMQTNEFSPEVLKAIRAESDSVGSSLLDQLPVSAPCLVMYVSKERRGLVANLTIPPEQPILEFRGKVCSMSDFTGRDADGRVLPYVLFYRGLQKGDGSLHHLDLSVDARFRGTDARFVRRSCQPNTQVKHVIKNGFLHLLLVSTELIESATEVTIPFDYDYRLCMYEVECACKILGNHDCPVEISNEHKRHDSDISDVAEMRLKKTVFLPLLPTKPYKAASATVTAKKLTKRAASRSTSKTVSSPSLDDAVNSVVVNLSKPRLGFKVKLKSKKSSIDSAPLKKMTPKKLISSEKIMKEQQPVQAENKVLSEADMREEKKLKQLMEQIARMEERERRRKEKQISKKPDAESSHIRDDTPTKRQGTSSSGISFDIAKEENHALENKTGETKSLQSPSFEMMPKIASAAATLVVDVERNVAKKRWLRQALSEEITQQFYQSPIEKSTVDSFAAAETGTYCGMTVAFEGTPLSLPTQEQHMERPLMCVNSSPRPSSATSSDDVVASAVVGLPAPPIKKKVRMSLDEYKKRKTTDDVMSENPPVTHVDEEAAPEACGSGSGEGGGGETSMQKSAVSFIPQLKETTVPDQPVRLGCLVDPNLTSSASRPSTLEELRRRIYGKSWSAAAEQDCSLAASSSSSQSQERPRMSLMDRLKTEFGLDDPA